MAMSTLPPRQNGRDDLDLEHARSELRRLHKALQIACAALAWYAEATKHSRAKTALEGIARDALAPAHATA
jgi:hypothetical protein